MKEVTIALIMCDDPRFNDAVDGLESLDYETFLVATRVMQLIVGDAVTTHAKQCKNCKFESPVPDFCETHREMMFEVDQMLYSEDAPLFKGILKEG